MDQSPLEIITVAAAAELPSLYTNHVVVERTATGSYRVEGRSNRFGLQQPSFPQFGSLEDAIGAAKRWAWQEDIAAVHVFVPTA